MVIENGLDMNTKTPVLYCSLAFGPIAPAAIFTMRHRKDPTHLGNIPESAVLLYEFEYLFGSSEKIATAFFKISCSRRRRSFFKLEAPHFIVVRFNVAFCPETPGRRLCVAHISID
jgi:hypothetical protein